MRIHNDLWGLDCGPAAHRLFIRQFHPGIYQSFTLATAVIRTISSAMRTLAHLIATTGLVGHLKPAPGTWGALAALPLAWVLHQIGGSAVLIFATILIFFIGIWATAQVTTGTTDHDPSHVVIDEVVGQWIALWPVSIGLMHSGASALDLWPGWVAAFVLFRLFDITKPGPVGWADRRNDAIGVMLDDVIAGIFAALGVGVLAYLAHGVVGL